MAKDSASSKPAKSGQTRQDRLKAALKANMGRRKAQARVRRAQERMSNEGKDPAKEGE